MIRFCYVYFAPLLPFRGGSGGLPTVFCTRGFLVCSVSPNSAEVEDVREPSMKSFKSIGFSFIQSTWLISCVLGRRVHVLFVQFMSSFCRYWTHIPSDHFRCAFGAFRISADSLALSSSNSYDTHFFHGAFEAYLRHNYLNQFWGI